MSIRLPIRSLIAALALLALAACDSGGQSAQESSPDSSAGAPAEATSSQPREQAPEAAREEPATGTSAGESDATRQAEAATEPPTQTASVDGGKAAAQELGCTACHAAQTKLVGPAYKDVAAKYGGDKARILERMKAAVKNGSSGTWTDVTGGTPMPPQPQAAGKDDKLEAVAEWIAGLAG